MLPGDTTKDCTKDLVVSTGLAIRCGPPAVCVKVVVLGTDYEYTFCVTNYEVMNRFAPKPITASVAI